MSYISKLGGLLLPFALAAGSMSANAEEKLPAGQEWKRIYFLDFGGNSTSDPVYRGTGLMAHEGTSSIAFSEQISKGVKYTIAKHAPANNSASWIVGGGDHTYPNDPNKGYYLLLNCPGSCPNKDCLDYNEAYIYQKQLTNALCSGVRFRFQAFVANMEAVCTSSSSVNYLTLGIYDGSNRKLWEQEAQEIGSGAVTPDGSLAWIEIVGDFAIPDDADLSTINFKIYPILEGEPGAEPNGYDFALDDIAIYVAQPSMEFSSTEFFYKEPATISASLSDITFFSNKNNIAYFWEYSPDNGVTPWVKVASGTYLTSNTFDYNIESFDKDATDGTGNGYYRLTIGTTDNIGSIKADEEPVCAVRNVFQINETKNKMNILLCEGESFVVDGTTFTEAHDGKTVSTPNNYEVTTEVIFNVVSEAEPTKICIGQEYPVNSGNFYDELGTYELNSIPVYSERISVNGNACVEKTLTQSLEVTKGIYTENDYEHICQGKFSVDGVLRTEVGTFRDTVGMGCQHTINVVVVHPVYDHVLEQTICEGSVYDGKTYKEGGVYSLPTKPYKSVFGCDSSVTMTLTVTKHVEAAIPDVEVCQSDFGENQTAFTFGGKNYKNTGKKDLVLDLKDTCVSKVTGCDSITNVHVVIHPMVHLQNDTLICRDQILFGKVWNVAGKYDHDFHYLSASGCDSIVTWHITVLDIQLKLRAEFNRTSVCNGNSANLIVDLVPSNVPLTWEPELVSTNPLHPTVLPDETTDYIAHAKNSVGCHATDTITITVNPNPSLSIDTVLVKERQLKINYFGGTPEYRFEILSQTGESKNPADYRTVVDDNTIENITRGSNILRLLDANGCVSDVPFSMLATPIFPDEFFSPNGDGIFDVWQIKGIEAYADKSYVRIFDRFGRQLFETRGYSNENDNNNGFTGEYNGNLLPSTDYWYIIDLEENDVQYVGHFTLLR